MFYKRLLFDRSKIYIAVPKYFCYLRYTHMTLSSLFSRIAGQTTILSMLCTIHCIHNFVAFESFGWRKDGFCYFQRAALNDRTADGLKKQSSVGRAVGRGGSSLSRTLSILHHLDLMVLTFGLILLPVILYPKQACKDKKKERKKAGKNGIYRQPSNTMHLR